MECFKLTCLYVHDHKFKRFNKSIFTEGKMTDEVFSRYVDSDEVIYILSRMEDAKNHDMLSRITLKNINFIPVKGISFLKIFSIYLIENFLLAYKAMNVSDFLVVRMPSMLGIFILVINIFFKKMYFIEVVGDAKMSLLASRKKPNILFNIFAFFIEILNKYFIKNANGVIYVTRYTLQHKYPTYGVISYASNVEISVKLRELKFIDYSIKSNIVKIGLIGSYNNHYKGIEDAIKAIKILRDKDYIIELHILGSGKLKDYYMNIARNLQIDNCIFFDGVLEGGNKVINWLESLDIYIQPSRTEGLPRSLIEAMSTGLPVIATDVGGIPELIPPEYLVKPGDYKLLSLKMERLIDSQELRFKNGSLNYDIAIEYDQSVLKQRRSDFWHRARELVKRHKK